MARGTSRLWLWIAPLVVGVAAALVFGTGFVLALRGGVGQPLGPPVTPETPIARAAPRDGVFRILVVGDSLAKGTGDETGKGFAVDVLEAFRKKGKAEITNLAVNGMESPEIREVVESPNVKSLAAQADLILVSAGGNDLSHGATGGGSSPTQLAEAVVASRERYAKNLRAILETLREANPKARIVVLGLYDPFGDDRTGGHLGASVVLEWNTLTQEIALGVPNVAVIPTFDLFAGRPDRLSADHYHPNAAAYEEIAKRILQVV
ncbi:MAG TPA: GDSL-type esterase/lipase family protein [Thermoanaerobaculia bacterium]|nr:GDSL-type esterase/lipase family protein [Thermoanaerobaculia bacterium]